MTGRINSFAALRRISNYLKGGRSFTMLRAPPTDLDSSKLAEWHFAKADQASEQGRPVEALEHFQKAVRHAPWRWQYYRYMAIELLQGFGDLDAAVNAFRKARRIRRKMARNQISEQKPVRYMDEFWTMQIGHTANMEPYVKREIMLGRLPQETILFVAPNGRIANASLLDHFSKFLTLVRDETALPLPREQMELLHEDYYLLDYPDGQEVHWWHAGAAIIQRWEDEGRPPLLSLSVEEGRRGAAALKQLGLPDGAWFVSLHVREGGFKRSHHSVQDSLNADIGTYDRAIKAIVARGGWVIRMGDPSMAPLPKTPGVVDYAHSALKADWLDIYLSAKCRFFVGVSSGLAYVPPLFGVPCVLTNWFPTATRPWHKGNIYIPKLYRLGSGQRLARFDEIFSSPLGWALRYAYAERDETEIVDNNPDEIEAVVQEMMDRLDGSFKMTIQDEALQLRYDRIANACRCFGRARIGRDFLLAYKHLLI